MIDRKCWTAAIGSLALAGCVSSPTAPTRGPTATVRPPSYSIAGLERVMGHDARALTALFGAPDLDIREESARKLQFGGGTCILDAYLYPPAAGREPVVTHIDARKPDGGDFDRATCVATLARRN